MPEIQPVETDQLSVVSQSEISSQSHASSSDFGIIHLFSSYNSLYWIIVFDKLVRRGTQVTVDQKIPKKIVMLIGRKM